MASKDDITPFGGGRVRGRFQALGDYRFCYEAFVKLGPWSRRRLVRALAKLQNGDTMARRPRIVVAYKRMEVIAFLDLLKREEAYARASANPVEQCQLQ